MPQWYVQEQTQCVQNFKNFGVGHLVSINLPKAVFAYNWVQDLQESGFIDRCKSLPKVNLAKYSLKIGWQNHQSIVARFLQAKYECDLLQLTVFSSSYWCEYFCTNLLFNNFVLCIRTTHQKRTSEINWRKKAPEILFNLEFVLTVLLIGKKERGRKKKLFICI